VEKSPAQTVVIVYIYDDMVSFMAKFRRFFLTNQMLIEYF